MGRLLANSKRVLRTFLAHLVAWCADRPVVFSLVLTALLVTLFYAEENWRGGRVWQTCKRDLQAKGARLDWDRFKPAPVPDAENFFKAAKMEDWFSGTGNDELGRKLSLASLADYQRPVRKNVLAVVRLASPQTRVTAGEADVVLAYGGGLLALSDFGGAVDAGAEPGAEILPIIMFDDVPLLDAIRNLVRHAKLNYEIDPSLVNAPNTPLRSISSRWENVTAREVLSVILQQHGMEIVGRTDGGPAWIQLKDGTNPKVKVEDPARERLEDLFCTALRAGGNEVPIPALVGAQQLLLLSQPLQPVNPVRVVVRTDENLTGKEIAQFFPSTILAGVPATWCFFEAESCEPNAFQVGLAPPKCYPAADYLAWSERCNEQFEAIREGLKRPHAQLETESAGPLQRPVPNSHEIRILAQTLAQRAQSHLLLKNPEAALGELTLLHGLSRIATRKPATLVGAMVGVALEGTYVGAVADGLRLGAWHEAELVTFEQQLKAVRLLPAVLEGFERERFHVLWQMEHRQLPGFLKDCALSSVPDGGLDRLTRLKISSYDLLRLVPRGWTYGNMAALARLQQEQFQAANAERGIVTPAQMDRARERAATVLSKRSPGTFLAAFVFPDFVRAWLTAAGPQALINQARVACALERYRRACGRYPDSLSALIPEFIDDLPHGVINGEPLVYRTYEEGAAFTLYSIGWDGVDDGGTVCDSGGRYRPASTGDWVWSTNAAE